MILQLRVIKYKQSDLFSKLNLNHFFAFLFILIKSMSNFGRSTIITFDFDDLFVQFIVLSDVSAESPKENTNHSDGNRKYNEPECDI